MFNQTIIAAQDGGGDLVELLVLFIIMAISALGSILKSRTKNRATKPSPTPRPSSMPPSEEFKPPTRRFEVPQAPGWQRRPQPKVLMDARVAEPIPAAAQVPHVPETEYIEPDPIPEPSDDLDLALDMTATQTTSPGVGLDLRLSDLSMQDLQRAIVLKELLGPPRAVQECGDFLA